MFMTLLLHNLNQTHCHWWVPRHCQHFPAFGLQDEISYARNVSFIDDDLDEGEIGAVFQQSERSRCGGEVQHQLMAKHGKTYYDFLDVFWCLFGRSWGKIINMIHFFFSVASIANCLSDLPWPTAGGYLLWRIPEDDSEAKEIYGRLSFFFFFFFLWVVFIKKYSSTNRCSWYPIVVFFWELAAVRVHFFHTFPFKCSRFILSYYIIFNYF